MRTSEGTKPLHCPNSTSSTADTHLGCGCSSAKAVPDVPGTSFTSSLVNLQNVQSSLVSQAPSSMMRSSGTTLHHVAPRTGDFSLCFPVAHPSDDDDDEIEESESFPEPLTPRSGKCIRPDVQEPKPVFQLYSSDRCRAGEWTSCERARVEYGLNFARKAALNLESLANQWLTSSSSTRAQLWQTHRIFVRYFGGYQYQSKWFDDDYRVKVLKRIRNIAEDCRLSTQHFLKIRSQTGKCNKKCEPNRAAYTNAEIIHRVYLCPLFFQSGEFSIPCATARLFIHEFGHKDGIIGDPVYGRSESIALAAKADKDFKTARKNADNYAFFFVNFLMDPHLQKRPWEDTHWCEPYKPSPVDSFKIPPVY